MLSLRSLKAAASLLGALSPTHADAAAANAPSGVPSATTGNVDGAAVGASNATDPPRSSQSARSPASPVVMSSAGAPVTSPLRLGHGARPVASGVLTSSVSGSHGDAPAVAPHMPLPSRSLLGALSGAWPLTRRGVARDHAELQSRVEALQAYTAALQRSQQRIVAARDAVRASVENLTEALAGLDALAHNEESTSHEREAAALREQVSGLEERLDTRVIAPLVAIQRSHAEIMLRLDQRRAAVKEYDAAKSAFQSVQRKGAGAARARAHPGGASGAEESPAARSMASLAAAMPSTLSLSRAWLRSLTQVPPTSDVEAGSASPASTAAAPDPAAVAAAEQARAVSRLAAAQTRVDVLTDALISDIDSVTAQPRRLEVASHVRDAVVSCFAPFFGAAAAVWLSAVDTVQADIMSVIGGADADNVTGSSAVHRRAPHGAASSSAAPWWDEGSVMRRATRASAEARREQVMRRYEAKLQRDVRVDARRSRSDSVAEVSLQPASERVLTDAAWLGRICYGLRVRDVARLSQTCKAVHTAVALHPDAWLAVVVTGGVDGLDTRPRGSPWTGLLDDTLAVQRHVRFWVNSMGAAPAVRIAPAWSIATRCAGSAHASSGVPFRGMSPEQLRAVLALAVAEGAAGSKRRAEPLSPSGGRHDVVEFDYDESSRPRWSVMIEQDVVRCYTGAIPFGESPALLRLQHSVSTWPESAASPPAPGAAFEAAAPFPRRRANSLDDAWQTVPERRTSSVGAAAVGRQRAMSAPATLADGALVTDRPSRSSSMHEVDHDPAAVAPKVLQHRDDLAAALMAAAVLETRSRYSQSMSMVMRFLLEMARASAPDVARDAARASAAGAAVNMVVPDEVSEHVLIAFNLYEALSRAGTVQTAAEPGPASVPVYGHGLAALATSDGASLRLYQLHRLLLRHFPLVVDRYSEHGLGTEAFAASWLMTMFSNFAALGVSGVVRVMDMFVVCGWRGVFAATLALMALIAEDIVRMPMEQCLTMLAHPRLLLDKRHGAGAFRAWCCMLPRALKLVDDADLRQLEDDFRQQHIKQRPFDSGKRRMSRWKIRGWRR